MKFFIPSHKRSNLLMKYTLGCLINYGIKKDDIFIFVDFSQEEEYKKICGEHANIIGFNDTGIGSARYYIQLFAQDKQIEYGFILDDDLQVLLYKSEKAPKGWWHNKYIKDAETAQKYLSKMEDDCLARSEILVGLTPRRVMHLDKPDVFSNGHPYGFYWLNFKKLKDLDIWYDHNMDHFEDYDITFQLLETGYNTKLYRDLGFSSFVIGTLEGGCYNNYQTKDLLSKARMLELRYQNIGVKLIEREIKNKSGQNNLSFKIKWIKKKSILQQEDFLGSITKKVVD